MAEYWLQIIFKSNEHPWRTNRYDAYKIYSDEDAIEWVMGMQKEMFEYQITLFKDGAAIWPSTAD